VVSNTVKERWTDKEGMNGRDESSEANTERGMIFKFVACVSKAPETRLHKWTDSGGH
jgi:hypothetical protein